MNNSRFFMAAVGVALAAFGYWRFSPQTSACQALSIQLTKLNLAAEEPSSPLDFYWGHALKVSVASGGNFQVVAWRVDGPATNDYEERVSDGYDNANGWVNPPAALGGLNDNSFQLYFLPKLPGEITVREISLDAKPLGSNEICHCKLSVNLKRYLRPVELYTSDHIGGDETNKHKGRVIDAHYIWHMFHMLGDPSIHRHPSFLHWHHIFVARYQSWRTLFGYPESTAWKPGDPVDPQELFVRGAGFGLNSLGTWTTQTDSNWESFENGIVEQHNTVHQKLQDCPSGTFGCFLGVSSPKTELFWRFHLHLDNLYQNYCSHHQGCPTTGDK